MTTRLGIPRFLALFAMLLTVLGLGTASGCGGDATRDEVEALRAELADLREGQQQLRDKLARLARPASAPRPAGARVARKDRAGKPRREVIRLIPTGSSPTLGNLVAAATVVEFGDFGSPAAQTTASLPRELLEAHPNDVLFVFKNYPRPGDFKGLLAAEAAWAAKQQGKFWEMYDLIVAGDVGTITPEVLRGYAQQLGLDLERYAADATSKEAARAVRADVKLGRQFRVRQAPTYFVNGRLVPGARADVLRQMVVEQIAKVKRPAGS